LYWCFLKSHPNGMSLLWQNYCIFYVIPIFVSDEHCSARALIKKPKPLNPKKVYREFFFRQNNFSSVFGCRLSAGKKGSVFTQKQSSVTVIEVFVTIQNDCNHN